MNAGILLSGGTGTRLPGDRPKQYRVFGGHMMITHALRPLLVADRPETVVIVCEDAWQEEILRDVRAAGLPVDKIAGFASPGTNRQLSILNGLEALLGIADAGAEGDGHTMGGVESDTVLIHDAARPFLSEELLAQCYAALDGYDGVLPVLPMKDTIYESADGVGIDGLPDRAHLFAGQAPELFLLHPYVEANRRLLPEEILSVSGSTQPAILAGMKIRMIPGEEKNTKITTPEDLQRLEGFF